MIDRRKFLSACCLMSAFGMAAVADAQSPRAPVRDSNRIIQKRVVSWKELKTQNVVMQQRDFSCGAAAMATVLRYYWGKDVSEAMILDTIERMLEPQELRDRAENGLFLGDLEDAAKQMGYLAVTGDLTLEKLLESKVPVILAIRYGGNDHFVVFRGYAAHFIFLADPIRGNVRMTIRDFAPLWIDNAILVVAPEGKTKSNVSRLDVRYDELVRGSLLRQQIRRQVTR